MGVIGYQQNNLYAYYGSPRWHRERERGTIYLKK